MLTAEQILEKYAGIEHLFIPARAELETLFQSERLTYDRHQTREQNWERYLAYRKAFAPIVCPWNLPSAEDRGSGRIKAAIEYTQALLESGCYDYWQADLIGDALAAQDAGEDVSDVSATELSLARLFLCPQAA